MKTYSMALPYFPKDDVNRILKKFEAILLGKGMLSMGRNVLEFEKRFAQYTGAKYAVAVNSCTSALEIVLRCIGLKSGDDVIVPTQTFIATGSCVALSGGNIRFADVDNNFLLDFADLRKKISGCTKAVIIVHFAGLIHPEIFEIRTYLKQRNIPLIEDAAHAPGAWMLGKSAGNIGDFGCFSFYATKIMTTGEGGAITTNNEKFYKHCSSLRNRGLDLSAKTERFSVIGSNRRFTEFQGILGLHQLRKLEAFVEHRNKVAAVYKDSLNLLAQAGIINFQNYPSPSRHAYWRFVVFLNNTRIRREEIKRKMAQSGIAVDWPYQPLLHLQPAFRKKRMGKKSEFARSEELARRHICLPIHGGISLSDAEFIADKLKRCLK